jgi:hypothetical protein
MEIHVFLDHKNLLLDKSHWVSVDACNILLGPRTDLASATAGLSRSAENKSLWRHSKNVNYIILIWSKYVI